jgi:hypothetical protein
VARLLKVAAAGVRPPLTGPSGPERDQDPAEVVMHHIMRELDTALAWKPDVLLLPQSCDAPLASADARCAAKVYEALSRLARERGCLIGYASARGSLVVIDRDGRETDAGAPQPLVRECSVGKVALIRTDDLFDDGLLARLQTLHPEMILFSSELPGGTLEQYWAFACRAHLASAVLYRSDLRLPCRIVSPVGALVATSTNYQGHAQATVNLDSAVVHLDDNRENLLRLIQRRPDGISVHDPGNLGAVLVSNEAREGSMAEILKEEGVETIDQYFGRYLAVREQSLALPRRRPAPQH